MVHTEEMQRTFTDLKGVVVGGDFNTNPDQADFVSERTLRIFTDAGFLNSFGAVPLANRITHHGKGAYPDATFDYLFLKNLKPVGVPEITGSVLSDHWPVTVEITTSIHEN